MLVVKTMIHVASAAGNFCFHIMGTVSQAVIPGSKINFLIWAPTGEQVEDFWSPESKHWSPKISPLFSSNKSLNTNKKCMVWTFLCSKIALLPLQIPKDNVQIQVKSYEGVKEVSFTTSLTATS